MGFHIRWQPNFVVVESLLKNKARSFLYVRKQTAGGFHVAHEVGFQPRNVMGFFVTIDDSCQLLDYFFLQFMCLKLGVGLEIEDQHVLSAESFVAPIYELASAEKYLDAGIVFFLFVALSFFFGLFFLGFFLGVAFLVFLDALLDPFVFRFLFFFIERLAVLLHQRRNFIPV